MIRAVLDTNVLLSGIVGVEREASTPGAIVRVWRAARFELITSQHIRSEVERYLVEHPYFSSRLTAEDVGAHLESLASDATQAAITVQVVGVASHPEGDVVLAAAVSAGADFLVSGDRDLQAFGSYQGVRIVDPRAFLDAMVVAEASTDESDVDEEGSEETDAAKDDTGE